MPPADDPLRLFADWYEVASRDESSPELTALATASPEARPSVRMVELQRFDARGFVFYTGAESRKGRELAANPYAALVFYWHGSRHQVRVEGRVEPAPLDAESATTTPADARQGEPVADRADLESRAARYGEPSALPSDWGAFRLVPDAYEFWEYRDDKLHDRFRYRLVDDGSWEVERLFP